MLKYYLLYKLLIYITTLIGVAACYHELKRDGYSFIKKDYSFSERIFSHIKTAILFLVPIISTCVLGLLVFKHEKCKQLIIEKAKAENLIKTPEEVKLEEEAVKTFVSSDIKKLCKKYEKTTKKDQFIKILGYDQIKNTDDVDYKDTLINAREAIINARKTITNVRTAASNARKSVLDSPVMENSYNEYHKALAAILAQKTDDSIHTDYIPSDSGDFDLCDLDEEIEKSFASENGDSIRTDCVPSDSGDFDLCDLDEEIEKSLAEDSLKGPKKSLHL